MTIFISYPRINPRIPYQPETLVSARGSGLYESLGLIRDSRVDTWVRYENCHMIISIYQQNQMFFFFCFFFFSFFNKPMLSNPVISDYKLKSGQVSSKIDEITIINAFE